jgi:glycosyltransferase involved in cell wall biosynthesis
LKLLLLCWEDPFTSKHGTEIYAGNLAVELAKQGHEVHIVCARKTGGNAPDQVTENLIVHPIHPINIPYIRAFDFCRECANKCSGLISEFQIDTVIAVGVAILPNYIFSRIKKLKRRPLLSYYAIDYMSAEYQRSKPTLRHRSVFKRLNVWIWYKVLIRSDRSSCNTADLVLASCEDTANGLIKDYHIPIEKVEVVYFGIPDDYGENLDIRESEIPTFFHVSTNPERKGTLYVIEALKVLQSKYNLRARGIIVGSKEPFHIRLAERLGVDVSFIGRIPNSEMKKYYAECTVLVSPSLSEGFCLPVIEAAMFNKSAIVTNAGSLPELVVDGENGFIVPVSNVAMLAERMLQIATNEQLRKRMSEKAKLFSQKFKISNTVKALIEILDNKMQRKPEI